MLRGLWLALVLIAAAMPVRAEPAGELRRKLVDYIEARGALGHFNGTVLVARGGEILLERGVGLANFEHRVPASAATRYAVASLTKQFTAAAILRLREQGRLRLEDSVCAHLDPCPEAWRPVTVRHLLNHGSGIVDYEEPRGLGSPDYIAFVTRPDHVDRIVAEAGATPLEFAPGTRFHYSNTGYVLLSRIVSRAAGVPFAQYLREQVLRRAGLTALLPEGRIVPGLAQGYAIEGLSLRRVAEGIDLADPANLRPTVMGNFSGEHGDASLIATARDLLRWVEALSAGSVIGAASVQEMTTPGRGFYGYGVEVSQQLGTRLVSHTGGLPGFASRLDWYPERNVVVVVLGNVEGIRFSAVARDLAAIALGLPYDVPVAHRIIELPAAALEPWVGEYRVASGTARIALRDGALHYTSPSGTTALLMPESPTRFYVPLVEGVLTFTPPSDGAPAALRLRYRDVDIEGRKAGERRRPAAADRGGDRAQSFDGHPTPSEWMACHPKPRSRDDPRFFASRPPSLKLRRASDAALKDGSPSEAAKRRRMVDAPGLEPGTR